MTKTFPVVSFEILAGVLFWNHASARQHGRKRPDLYQIAKSRAGLPIFAVVANNARSAYETAASEQLQAARRQQGSSRRWLAGRHSPDQAFELDRLFELSPRRASKVESISFKPAGLAKPRPARRR